MRLEAMNETFTERYTSTGNVLVARWVMSFVTIPLLDLVMIH